MARDWQLVLAVDKKVKPIPHTKRQAVELKVGGKYYVSFGNNKVTSCSLVKIQEIDGYPTKVDIEVPAKAKSKKGFIGLDGNISHHWVNHYRLYADEIGTTPEQAVLHEVTL